MTRSRRFLATLVASCCALLAFASLASAQERLLAADGAAGTESNLYVLDPTSGAVLQTVGPIGFSVTGLAIDPATGTLYGTTGRELGINDGSLITIDKNTGAGTLVGDLRPDTETAVDITFTPDGTLYGWLRPTSNDLVTINKTTGAATIVGDSGLSGFGGGLASNAAGTLFLAAEGDAGPLRTVDSTGATTAGPTMDGTADDSINALAFDSAGTLFGSRRTDDLLTINTSTGAVTVVGPSVADLDAIVFDGIPSPAGPAAPAAPAAPAKKDPKCKHLRKKLKRQKKKLAKATTEKKRAHIQDNIEDTKRRLKRLGC